MNRAELKKNAKASLKGNYGQAILLMFLAVAIPISVALIGCLAMGLDFSANGFNIEKFGTSWILLGLIISVATAAIALGEVNFYLKISRNKEASVGDLFSKVNLFLPYICVSIITGFVIGLGTILLVVPGIIAALNYALVSYILVDNPELGVMGSIKKSKEMMKGHRLQLVVLILSFYGWAILGVLTLGILYLWLIPYMNVTMANFYNTLRGPVEEEVEEKEEEETTIEEEEVEI